MKRAAARTASPGRAHLDKPHRPEILRNIIQPHSCDPILWQPPEMPGDVPREACPNICLSPLDTPNSQDSIT